MIEELPVEAIPQELLEEKQTVHKYNQDLLNLITAIIESTLESKDAPLNDVTFQAVKSVLRSPQIRPTVGSVIPAIFVYYLQAFRQVSVNWDLHHDGKLSRTEDELLGLAALQLLDLYVAYPNDHTGRLLAEMAAKSLHEVIVAKVSTNEELEFKDVLGRLSTLAMLTETIKDYMVKSRRKKNLPYITWLRSLLEKCLASENLTLLETDNEVRKVVSQVTNKAKVVVL